jgi:phage tail sheath protein FI
MANFTVSPGVTTNELDQTFLTGQPVQAGAAIIGPTVKGPYEVPTLVTSYSQYTTLFGDTFISGGINYSYLTSIAAYNYFNYGGSSLLVARVASGSFTAATSSNIPSQNSLTDASISVPLTYISASFVPFTGSIAQTSASIDVDLTYIEANIIAAPDTSESLNINGINLIFTGSNETNTSTQIFINTASFSDPITGVVDYVVSASAILAFSSSFYSPELDFISSSANSPNLNLTFTGSNGVLGNFIPIISGSTTFLFSGSDATNPTFEIGTNYVTTQLSQSLTINGIELIFTGSNEINGPTQIFINTASFAASTVADYVVSASAILTFSSSIAPYSSSLQFISSSISSPNLVLTSTTSNGLTGNSFTIISGSTFIPPVSPFITSGTQTFTTSSFTGGTNSESFVLETISEGIVNNSTSPETSGVLSSGSKDNLRWEITNLNTASGTFNVSIRQGNDTPNNKLILESFNNVSLDPNSNRFISLVIGDQKLDYNAANNQMELTGNYRNISKYVRVKSIPNLTPNYLDANGIVSNNEFITSLPSNQSGSFGDATGTVAANVGTTMYENIGATTQGLVAADYTNMVALFGNREAFQFNVLFTPGITNNLHPGVVSNIISNTQDRGDNLYVLDLIDYNGTVASTIVQANARNTSYAASYWPWVRIVDPATGKQVWVPASTVIPGVYAFNDKVSAPWFAPAGINRGGLSTVLQAQFKLTQANKDALYSNNINPLATLPKNGVVVFGQKTLQKEQSALDRVNVRRLLIELKNFIRQIADTVVFEQNTIATRASFTARVTPFLEGVQQKQGLYAYKIVMDESNNGPAVIDQNQLIGQIYIQPTRTAEFISLDFILLPTGAEFPG